MVIIVESSGICESSAYNCAPRLFLTTDSQQTSWPLRMDAVFNLTTMGATESAETTPRERPPLAGCRTAPEASDGDSFCQRWRHPLPALVTPSASAGDTNGYQRRAGFSPRHRFPMAIDSPSTALPSVRYTCAGPALVRLRWRATTLSVSGPPAQLRRENYRSSGLQ